MKIHQPHDKLFKETLGRKRVVVDLVKAHLAPEDLEKLDLSSVKLQNNSFVDGKYNAFYSDVIHKVDGVDGEGYLYFLLEHQSTSDPMIVGKLICYIGHIINADIKRQLENMPKGKRGKFKIPTIYPFVIYSGKEKYQWPEQLTMADIGLDFVKLRKCLIELRKYTLEELMKSGKAALVQLLLKESWKKDFCTIIDNTPQLGKLINSSPYADDALLYIVDQDPHSEKVLRKIQGLNEKLKQRLMGNLMKMRQSERREGRLEGRLEALKETFHNLLANGIERPQAAKLLGLTPKKLKALLSA